MYIDLSFFKHLYIPGPFRYIHVDVKSKLIKLSTVKIGFPPSKIYKYQYEPITGRGNCFKGNMFMLVRFMFNARLENISFIGRRYNCRRRTAKFWVLCSAPYGICAERDMYCSMHAMHIIKHEY